MRPSSLKRAVEVAFVVGAPRGCSPSAIDDP
jgi:hypothetical protein